MADHRGVHSSRRRITPAPQPPPKATTTSPPAARTTRRRGARSASRDVDEPTKPARRSARQASIASVLGENEPDARALSRAKRQAQKEAIPADLTVVEEVQIPNAPASPPRTSTEIAIPRRSLGAVSEMSGTTAISSFTMVEAETLEPRFMLRYLSRLHEEVVECLDHLVPAEGGMVEDAQRIELLHDPNSDFLADYNAFDLQLRARLSHYRGDNQQYIHIRAAHAALFPGPNQDAATRTGLDLLLYQANLIVFAKDMMPLERNDKTTVAALRDLDTHFPSLFLPALTLDINAAESAAGESALLQETFELALELRTQLAISSLSHGLTDNAFDPDAALDEVFCHPPESIPQLGVFRGWSTFELGGEDSPLPGAFVQKVVARMAAIREFFSTGETSQGQEGSVNLDDLSATFPWTALVLRLVGWVRARDNELAAAIHYHGGARGILEMIKAEKERAIAVVGTGRVVSRSSPRKSRSSFGRNRRRSSGKFDPNAEVDTEVLSKLIAREGAHPQLQTAPAASTTLQESQEEEAELMAMEHGQEMQQDDDVESQPYRDDEGNDATNAVEQHVHDLAADDIVPTPVEEILNHPLPVQEPEILEASRPPQSTNDFVSLLKETRSSDKENRGISSLFERQANAQRVQFGDGFDDSQPTPGPSRSQPSAGASRKGKEPQRPSPRKRKIHEVSDDDDDDDAFETAPRSRNIQQQRANAPKRVRIEPSSSGAPTSHQPRPKYFNDGFQSIEDFPRPENDEPSEPEAPEMTEEAPPRSTFDDIRALARANAIHKPRRRRINRPWTTAEEEALISYMSECPRQYSKILQIDRDSPRKYFHALENGEWIAYRSQVDLKDKARVMAKNMIKAGAGLRPGFQGVITPAMEQQLRADGFHF
ncbi:uncharacterized protein CC84DRAFT_1085793 [Paraphaeosphaeria sporulosa]|uniref:Myb-like domain-containing protein n=1 Tax=Paraphaeosphaeria sporulosa TaxID=1460663 RepID=A0A177CMT3_9PLEO|nr:uncharacterized protein CC84DRAFT_1085793 [Paraphaeosphaeria sporulosa]OAG08262.1 hypothetical protein CC84DRAFT_1085793 [Paraphaeosphaeria sporulosa]